MMIDHILPSIWFCVLHIQPLSFIYDCDTQAWNLCIVHDIILRDVITMNSMVTVKQVLGHWAGAQEARWEGQADCCPDEVLLVETDSTRSLHPNWGTL